MTLQNRPVCFYEEPVRKLSDSKEHLRYSPRPKRDGMKTESKKERKSESEAKESSVSLQIKSDS